MHSVETGVPLSVLVVDDDKLQHDLVRRAFRHEGVEVDVRIASTGEEAEKELCSDAADPPPHVVLLDLGLPGMDGVALLKKLRQSTRCSELAVFIMSASIDPKERASCYDLGISGFIFKDCLESMLESVRMVTRVVSGKHFRQRDVIDDCARLRTG